MQELYERHGSALAAYLCCRGLDFASAEDIVQDVFLKFLKGQNTLPEAASSYLYRAVRNAMLNHRRNRRSDVEFNETDEWLVEPTGKREEVTALKAALRDLPSEQRETVFLKVWGGLTLQEIATALDVSINTAAARYRYALEKLRERLQPPAK